MLMISAVALVALFAAGLTLPLRATVAKGLTLRGVKPWACDLCMSLWGACVGALLCVEGGEIDAHGAPVPFAARLTLVVLGAIPVSMLVLRFVSQPTKPFELPPANDNDGDILR